MKLSAIKKLITESKRALIVRDQDGVRWLGDGLNFYAMDDGIPISKESVLAILDVDKDKRDKITPCEWSMPIDARFGIYPNEDTDERLMPCMAVLYGGEPIMIFMTEAGEIVGVKQAAIKPVEARFGIAYQLRRRWKDGEEKRPVITCSEDAFVSAILMPIDTEVTRSIVSTMKMLSENEIKLYGGKDKEEAEILTPSADEE